MSHAQSATSWHPKTDTHRSLQTGYKGTSGLTVAKQRCRLRKRQRSSTDPKRPQECHRTLRCTKGFWGKQVPKHWGEVLVPARSTAYEALDSFLVISYIHFAEACAAFFKSCSRLGESCDVSPQCRWNKTKISERRIPSFSTRNSFNAAQRTLQKR